MLSRLVHTVRYLKPGQVYGRMYRPRPRVDASMGALRVRTAEGAWVECIVPADPRVGERRFRLLNEEREIATWNDADVPRLWLYHLHYHDRPSAALIDWWMRENPVGEGRGWEPYPLSRRIPNWIKAAAAGMPIENAAVASLAVQARYLAQSVEHHLLGNHLFVNAKALVYAGTWFVGKSAERWRTQGLRILRRELGEQVLGDGGHFERSPMYHALILEDVLDLVNLAEAYPHVLPADDVDRWREAAARMLGWLEQMCHPDGRIAFFNDATFDVAADLAGLGAYAGRLGIEPERRPLAESGYVRLERGDAVLIFDAAPVGPDYQPGHAHADTLSFELSLKGRRVLVNSGVSTYESNETRHAERGTAAHNTVKVDGENQSEVWSAFRVARRARPINVCSDRRTFCEAAHTGYRRLQDPVTHARRLVLRDRELVVTDHLEGLQNHRAELFFHFHPESGANDAVVCLDPQFLESREATVWAPGFNRRVPNTTIVGRWSGRCPIRFESFVRWA